MKINAAWQHHFYGQTEQLFVRCRKDGKLGKPLSDKTAVYLPYEVMQGIENGRSFKVHWKSKI